MLNQSSELFTRFCCASLVYFCNTVFLISTLLSCFRYLAAMLVINWLSSHEDLTLQRMAVAVISILVAKVKTFLARCALVCCWKIVVAPFNPTC